MKLKNLIRAFVANSNFGFGIWNLEFGIWNLEFGIWILVQETD
jgi:hypothetical protein